LRLITVLNGTYTGRHTVACYTGYTHREAGEAYREAYLPTKRG